MNVTCPECSSVFRVDPAKIPLAGVRARCSVCGGVIAIGERGRIDEDFTASTPAAAGRDAGAPASVGIARRCRRAPPVDDADTAAADARAASPRSAARRRSSRRARPRADEHALAAIGGDAAAAIGRSRLPQPRADATPRARRRASALRRRPRPPAPPPAAPPAARHASAASPRRPRRRACRHSRRRAPPQPSHAAPHRPPAIAGACQHATLAAPGALRSPGAGARAPLPPQPGAPVARPPINPFLANDPNQKAKRLARALVSDIIAYFPDRMHRAKRDGTLRESFREEIKKSYEEYVEQMGKEFAENTTHFQDALNDVLAGGAEDLLEILHASRALSCRERRCERLYFDCEPFRRRRRLVSFAARHRALHGPSSGVDPHVRQ